MAVSGALFVGFLTIRPATVILKAPGIWKLRHDRENYDNSKS